MELFLIRHGQSANNAVPVEEREQDPPLTELGNRQAEHMARKVGALGLTRLITSPFLRTLQTTEYVRRTTGLTPEVWVDFHEQGGCIDGHDFETFEGRPGMTAEELRQQFPGYRVPEEIDHRGWWKCKPYEPPEEAQARAERTTWRTQQQFAHTDEKVGVVFHGTFKRYLVGALLGIPDVERGWLGEVNNTALSKFLVTPRVVRLEFYNAVGHLPDELVT